MRLARNLRALLDERGWSQTRLMYESRIPQTTISAVACGRGGTTLKTLRRLKAALGCSWDELLGD